MRNLLITIRFCGVAYHGFQVQKNAITVCEVFQDGVEKLLGRRPDVKGCSRTDAGVHANHYCLSMQLEDGMTAPCHGLQKGLNSVLPGDITVLDCRDVAQDFHARYNCRAKRYVYIYHNAPLRDPFLRGRAYHCDARYTLDEKAMNEAAAQFVGRHDFTSFCAAGGSVEDKHRSILSAEVKREGDIVKFWVTGDGFLYNMVRIMAGTLLEVGQGRRTAEEIPAIIDSCSRSEAGITLPPDGLYLDKVYYDENPGP